MVQDVTSQHDIKKTLGKGVDSAGDSRKSLSKLSFLARSLAISRDSTLMSNADTQAPIFAAKRASSPNPHPITNTFLPWMSYFFKR